MASVITSSLEHSFRNFFFLALVIGIGWYACFYLMTPVIRAVDMLSSFWMISNDFGPTEGPPVTKSWDSKAYMLISHLLLSLFFLSFICLLLI